MFLSETCNKDSPCMNGGNCTITDEGSYCVCELGTEGDMCEKVPECENKECGKEATCVYDVKLKRIVCRCNEPGQSFVPGANVCKRK